MIKGDRVFLKTPVDYGAFALFVVYFISVALYIINIQISASPRLALSEWLKYEMYISVFLMATDLAYNLINKITLMWTIVITSLGLSVLGYDGATGEHIASILNTVTKKRVFFDLFVSNRISSTLQYPNAFAAYLLAAFFISVILMKVSSGRILKMLAGASSFVIFNTFIYTQSRGAQLLLFVVIAILLIALPKGSRISTAANIIPAALSSGVLMVLGFQGNIASKNISGFKVWGLLLLGIAISAVLTFLLKYLIILLEKINPKVYIAVTAAIPLLLAAAYFYISNLSQPVTLEHTSSMPDSHLFVSKGVQLEPGKTYKLQVDLEAMSKGQKPYSYIIRIANKRLNDIIRNDSESNIFYQEFGDTKGKEQKTIDFKVPEESRIVYVYLENVLKDTRVTFYNAKVLDAQSGSTVKNLVLKYKYLEPLFSKFENALASRSAVERLIFYKDGLKIFKDRWFLGWGGGAWPSVYFANQSYLYWSTQAHNYFLQVGIETGIVGLLALLFLIFSIIYLYVRDKKFEGEANRDRIIQAGVFTAIAALLGHSAIDFDLSLSSVSILLWVLIGIYNSRYRLLMNTKVKEEKFTNYDFKTIRLHPALGIIPVFITVIVVIMLVSAASSFRDSNAYAASDFTKALESAKSASSSDPLMAQYKLQYVQLLLKQLNTLKSQEDYAGQINAVTDTLKKAENLCRYSPDLAPQLGAGYVSIKEFDKGLAYVEKGPGLRPMRREEWYQYASAVNTIISYLGRSNKMSDIPKYADRILQLPAKAEEVNKRNMNPFTFNSITMEIIEGMMYLKQNSYKAVNKAVFYSMPGIDIDRNGIPDQWELNNVSINAKNSVLSVAPLSSSRGFIKSRVLSLAPGKSYHIKLKQKNNQSSAGISYEVAGTNISGQLQNSGNVFVTDFKLPDNSDAGDKSVRLYIDKSMDIESLVITEK